ncbi:MAG: EamA family transporter [Candidatus Zixiibacteriota bacterium]|nr:MAG: EamA family transporter [candidate division Zixibacteria bacterium]
MSDRTLKTSRNNTLAHIGLFYTAAIWGSTFFVVKDVLSSVDPVILVAYRFLLAGIILLAYLLARRQPILAGIRQAAFLAVILYLLYIPQTVGLKFTTASNSGFITGLFVAFVPVFLRTIFRRTPTLMEVVGSAVSLIGLWVLTGGMKDVNIGDMLTLLAAVTYALHVLYCDKYMKAGMDPFILTCQQFLIVGLLALVTGLVLRLPLSVGSTSAHWVIVFLAVFPTLSACVIQLVAQKILSPVRVSLIFALEPVFAGLFAWTLGGEEIISHRALGGMLIFIALILSGLPTPAWAKYLTNRWRQASID